MADEAEGEAKEGKGSNKLVLILIIIIVVLLLGGGGVAAWLLMGSDDAAPTDQVVQEVKREAIYVKIRTEGGKPYFIANFTGDRGNQRFLQVYVEARTRDEAVRDALQTHMPLIVAELQVLFSSQSMHDLQTQEGRAKLQQESTEKIQAILQEEIGQPGIEKVFFTNFVMQ